MSDWIVSVDLGKSQDPAAICVTQIARIATGQTRRNRKGKIVEKYRSEYHVRYLEQPKLRTPYRDIVARVKTIMDRPELAGAHLVVDGTGVGEVVLEMFADVGLRPVSIVITPGQSVSYDDDKRGYHVPKRELAAILQVLFPADRIRIADGLKLAGKLAEQLRKFRVKFTAKGNDTYEALKENDHDDLVIALALAVWFGERGGARFGLWFETPAPKRGSVAWEQEELRKMRATLQKKRTREPWWKKTNRKTRLGV